MHATDLSNMRHSVCDRDFAPALQCNSCRESVTAKDVVAQRGASGSWQRSAAAGDETRARPRSARSNAGRVIPQTMGIIGNRWGAALLVAAFRGAARFSDFQTWLGAPPTLIADRLEAFCASGVLSAAPHYQLTEKGLAFFPVLVTGLQWAQHRFRAPEGPAVLLTHHRCGNELVGVLTCDQCAEPLAGADVAVVPRRP
jgi:DNA-binding HxlR family transcriptional regulator